MKQEMSNRQCDMLELANCLLLKQIVAQAGQTRAESWKLHWTCVLILIWLLNSCQMLLPSTVALTTSRSAIVHPHHGHYANKVLAALLVVRATAACQTLLMSTMALTTSKAARTLMPYWPWCGSNLAALLVVRAPVNGSQPLGPV